METVTACRSFKRKSNSNLAAERPDTAFLAFSDVSNNRTVQISTRVQFSFVLWNCKIKYTRWFWEMGLCRQFHWTANLGYLEAYKCHFETRNWTFGPHITRILLYFLFCPLHLILRFHRTLLKWWPTSNSNKKGPDDALHRQLDTYYVYLYYIVELQYMYVAASLISALKMIKRMSQTWVPIPTPLYIIFP